MYLDVKGLITCGMGNLIDTPAEAQRLPWLRPDGTPATQQEISNAWHLLKARPDLARRNARYAGELTGLVLTDAAVDELVAKKLASNEQYLETRFFPDFGEFPADAQLGILSMAWAAGPGFPVKFPSFTKAVKAGDWAGAVEHCTLREANNPGVVPRNKADRICFANAEISVRVGLDPEVLWWPGVAPTANVAVPITPELQDLSAAALDDARVYALELNRLSAHREMAGAEDEPTRPENKV
jgi:hypothetical protein